MSKGWKVNDGDELKGTVEAVCGIDTYKGDCQCGNKKSVAKKLCGPCREKKKEKTGKNYAG